MKAFRLFSLALLFVMCFSACEKIGNPSADGELTVPNKGKLIYTIKASDDVYAKDPVTKKMVSYFDKNENCDILEYYSDEKLEFTVVYENDKYYKIDNAENRVILEENLNDPFFHILGVPNKVSKDFTKVEQNNGIVLHSQKDNFELVLSKVEKLDNDIKEKAKDIINSALKKEDKLENDAFPYTSWMKGIPDSVALNDITLPGTHDSGTEHTTAAWPASLWANCQDSPISDQLSMGIRLFDLRLGYYEGDICLYHGSYRCLTSQKYWFFNDPDPVKLKDVLNTCETFLKNNPSETIVLQLKQEYDDGWSYQRWLDKGLAEIQKKGTRCIMDQTKLPKLGEARGKIVIISRNNPFGDDYGNFCAHFTSWPDDEPLFQCTMGTQNVVNFEGSDAYGGYWSNDSKWEIVEDIFDNHNFNIGENKGLVTFTSGTGASCPRDLASVVSDKICTYNFKSDKCYGWVFMDFVEHKHTRSLIEPYLAGFNK